jgi:hypothetical protein
MHPSVAHLEWSGWSAEILEREQFRIQFYQNVSIFVPRLMTDSLQDQLLSPGNERLVAHPGRHSAGS